MKTKIGIPIGLALVMFLGVFTAMLAFGVIAPTGVQGADQPVNTGGTGQDVNFGANATATRSYSSTVMTGGMIDVTLTVSNMVAGDVRETLPEGFSFHYEGGEFYAMYPGGTDVPQGAIVHPYNEDSQTVEFSLLGAAPATYTITYKVMAPGTAGTHGPITGYLGYYDGTGTLIDLSPPTTDPAVSGITVSSTTTPSTPVTMVSGFMVENTVKRPGAVSGYSFSFVTAEDLVANEDTITVHIDKDFKGHGTSLSRNHVTVSAYMRGGDATFADGMTVVERTGAYNPGTDATLDRLSTADLASHGAAYERKASYEDGEKMYADAASKPLTNSAVLDNIEYLISVPDMNGTEDGAPGIRKGSTVTLTISPAAGITNATASGNKGPLGVYTSEQKSLVYSTVKVNLGIALNDYDANRGKALTVLGSGFQDGTTATVYLFMDTDCAMKVADVTEQTELVSEPIASDDTFQAQLTVTLPPFKSGKGNCIYAQDGNEPPQTSNVLEFEVEGLLTISPTSAAVGDKVDITLEDWPLKTDGSSDTATVTIAGQSQTITSGSGSIGRNGTANFQIEIHTNTPSGTDEIKVSANGESDDKKITISGAHLSASPTTAVPNQAITVNGQGFTGDSTINAVNDGSEVTLGGDDEALSRSAGGFRNFNNGESVTVDSGGSWSATIIVPITRATTTPGTHSLDVTDKGNRSGSVDITIPERTLDIDPPTARPGETVTLTGSGFPASNTRSKEDNTPSIEITYDDDLVGTAIPDGDGNITLSFRVPLDASIPSTNRVEAMYEIPNTSTEVNASVNHEVPGARVKLSMDEGKPGDNVTITGDGFKAFASVEYVRIGGIEVTPAPRPATDRNGEFSATILVPDLAAGTNSVEAKVGVTAHANFKVLEAGYVAMTPGVMMAEAATPDVAFAAVIAEDNLIAVYHFDPATQNEAPNYGYTVYDARPLFMSGNNLDSIEPGQFYTVEVSEDQMGVTLGSQTVDLYAAFTPIRW